MLVDMLVKRVTRVALTRTAELRRADWTEMRDGMANKLMQARYTEAAVRRHVEGLLSMRAPGLSNDSVSPEASTEADGELSNAKLAWPASFSRRRAGAATPHARRYPSAQWSRHRIHANANTARQHPRRPRLRPECWGRPRRRSRRRPCSPVRPARKFFRLDVAVSRSSVSARILICCGQARVHAGSVTSTVESFAPKLRE